jgi:hypothetical protein
MASPALALRFLSGPHQGAVFALDPAVALVVGRGEEADLVLQDDLVSRRHVRLSIEGGALLVEDLGSTNGTFVNGARTERGRAGEGDRLLVGATLMRIVGRGRPEAAGPPARVGAAPPLAEERVRRGRLEDAPLPDLLQLLATSRSTCAVLLERDGHGAEILIERGRMVGCAVDGRVDISPRKSLHRLLAWTAGIFELREAVASSPPGAGEPLEPLIADGIAQIEDLMRLRPRLPTRVAVAGPLQALPAVDAVDRTLLVLAEQRHEIQDILDATPLSDLEAAQRIAALLTRGLLVAG